MNKELRNAVYGLAIGDALGVPYEFKERGEFECTEMTGFGAHGQPEGTWSDDTSMTIATAKAQKDNEGKVVLYDMVGVMIDRFGKDIIIVPEDEDHFSITVNVAVSEQFIGWIIALGENVKITGPEDVVKQMQQAAKRLTEQYLV